MKRSSGVGVGPERRVRRHVHEPRTPVAPGPVERELGPADVHVEQLPYAALRMDHRRGVEHGRVVDAVEEPIERVGVAHVTDDDFDAGIDDFEQRRVSFVAHETPDALAIGIARERADEVLTQPARTPADDSHSFPWLTACGRYRCARDCAGIDDGNGRRARHARGRRGCSERPTRGDRARPIVGLAFLVPLRGLLRAPGPPMEEGFMLVFPERVLDGDVPNRDFLHLYGPGSLWALAGAVQGVRRLAAHRAAVRARAADARRVRRLRARASLGPHPRGRVRAHARR